LKHYQKIKNQNNMKTTPLTQQLLKQFMTKAYENAKAKGFYKPDLDINQALMLIITEMGEAIQASRHNRHGSIEDYNKWLGVSEEQAYEESLEGTVESEFADVALRIMSLLGWYDSQKVICLMNDTEIKKTEEYHKVEFEHGTYSLPDAMYLIITRMTYFPFSCSPAWMNTLRLQDILVQVFALAHIEGIDLVEHIKLKMQYNESRPYLHGCLY
jgi:NTP pyrophosphatase (non-canonical NTP hydrolase)